MSSPATRRTPIPRALALVVAVLALVATTGATLPAPSIARAQPAAAQPTAGVATQVPGGAEVATVTLSRVSPAVATGDDVLRLSGVLVNTADFPLTDPLPALRWSGDPLQDVDEVDLVSRNPLFRYGRIDYRFADPLDTLAPGEQAPFSIEVPLASLGIGSGVFVLGVDVLASLPDGLRVFVADARTTVPVDVEVDEPLPVAVLWPLAAAPSLLPDGRLVDDRLATEVGEGGRLQRLLSSARSTPVTWVVDPDLVTTLSAMAAGYEVVGTGDPGTGSEAAERYLDDLVEVLGSAEDVRQIPAADPDVGGSLAAGVEAPTVRTAVADGVTDTSASTLAGRPLPPLALLADRPVTSRMLGVYRRAGIETSVLSAEAVTAPSPDGRETVVRDRGADVEAFIARVPPAGTASGDDSTALAARQWMLSATAVHANLGTRPAAMVVAAPPRWTPSAAEASALLEAWESTDWVEPVALADVPNGPDNQSEGDTGPVTLVAGVQPTPLPTASVDGLAGLLDAADRLQPLFAEPVLDAAEIPRVIARSSSYAWQADPDAGERYLRSLTSQVVDAESQISLLVSPSITLASRSGRFPITLVNDAAVDVVVGVEFTSQNSSRLRVEDIEPVILTAGEKRTFTPTALATANGRLQVSAALVTTEGSTVGDPATTIVDVTNVGALGWTVIGAGGVLLVAALVRARWRGRRSEAPAVGAE